MRYKHNGMAGCLHCNQALNLDPYPSITQLTGQVDANNPSEHIKYLSQGKLPETKQNSPEVYCLTIKIIKHGITL